MHNCVENQEKLAAYVDGELSHAEQIALEKHMDACEACRLEVKYLKELTAACHLLPAATVPDGFREQLHNRLVAQSPVPVKPWFVQWRTYATLAASLAFILLMHFTLVQTTMQQTQNAYINDTSWQSQATKAPQGTTPPMADSTKQTEDKTNKSLPKSETAKPTEPDKTQAPQNSVALKPIDPTVAQNEHATSPIKPAVVTPVPDNYAPFAEMESSNTRDGEEADRKTHAQSETPQQAQMIAKGTGGGSGGSQYYGVQDTSEPTQPVPSAIAQDSLRSSSSATSGAPSIAGPSFSKSASVMTTSNTLQAVCSLGKLTVTNERLAELKKQYTVYTLPISGTWLEGISFIIATSEQQAALGVTETTKTDLAEAISKLVEQQKGEKNAEKVKTLQTQLDTLQQMQSNTIIVLTVQ
ncbi:MAG: zf-HC2 domain-containing protein [Hyphomonadaceae bacterium]|nr:zf-HC2 domain-containing protein [Clostridia bacterium]